MIYLKNISDVQTLLLPRNGENASDSMTLSIWNTIDRERLSFEVQDLGEPGIYCKVQVSLPEGIQEGEYEYCLESDEGVISSGLLNIGSSVGPSEYEKETTYRQYESE